MTRKLYMDFILLFFLQLKDVVDLSSTYNYCSLQIV